MHRHPQDTQVRFAGRKFHQIGWQVLLLLGAAIPVSSAVYTVDTTIDSNAPGYRSCQVAPVPDCSLRGALLKANANPGEDTIVLQPGFAYSLSVAGSKEDLGATGDLDILDDLLIDGRQAVINAAEIDRVFHVLAGVTKFSQLTVTGGLTAGSGGGVLVEDADLWLREVFLEGNEAGSHGGGLFFSGGTLDIADSNVAANVSTANINGDGGGLHVAGGTAVVVNTDFDSNRADYGGAYFGRGGAVAVTGGSLTLVASTISNNISGYHGGGVYSTSTLVLSDVVVESNLATFRGGGLAMYGGEAEIAMTTVIDNSSDWGGGIYNEASVVMDDATVQGNSAIVGGGIFQLSAIGAQAGMTIIDSKISENLGTGGTGGLHSAGGFGLVELFDTEVSSNQAVGSIGGGGVSNVGDASGVPTMELTRSKIFDNTTTANGGGLNNHDAIMRVYATSVWGNSAARSGGAIYSSGGFNGGLLVFNRSIARDNVASERGGALYVFGGGQGLASESIAVLNNSTLSGNTAMGRGGALALKEGAVGVPSRPAFATFYNVTMKGNRSLGGPGGALSVADGTAEIYNTIVQSAQVDCVTTSGGQIVSGNYNIESGTSCGLTQPSDQQSTDPLLAPLANNGGDTLTHALLNVSPAIDAGNPLGCVADRDGEWGIDASPLGGDQRSFQRANVCDVGAFEVQ